MSPSHPGDDDALPEPPADIHLRHLPLIRRAARSRYLRIHRVTDAPVWFGRDRSTRVFRPPVNRFDAPDHSSAASAAQEAYRRQAGVVREGALLAWAEMHRRSVRCP